MSDAAATETTGEEPRSALLEAGLNAARASFGAGDVSGALAAYATLRDMFPDAVEPFLHAAQVLTGHYHFDEAEILLDAAAERFPHDPSVAADHARIAGNRGDTPAALRRWESARRLFPDDGAVAAGLAQALLDAGKLEAADTLLRTARTRFLDLCQIWTVQANALLAAERYDEADAVLVAAIERFPADPDPWIAHAKLAALRRDWPEASHRWGIVREQHPRKAEACAGQAAVWRDLGQFDAADAVLAEGMALFPDDPGLLAASASVAQAKRDWPAAVERWALVRRRFPGLVDAFLASIDTLRDAGRMDEAEALAVDALRRFPAHPVPAIAYARLAEARQDGPAAVARWNQACLRFLDRVEAWQGAARCLREMQRPAEAEAALAQIAARFPERAGPMAVRALGSTPPIRVAVAGFHLARQIALLLGRMIPFQGKLDVRWINAGMAVDNVRARLPDDWLDGAAVYFEESMAGTAATKDAMRALLPAGAATRSFPTSRLHAFWPFHGPDHRLVPEPPFYNGGRYPDPDGFAASLVDPAITDDALFDMYMELTEAAPLDLDALLAADLDRLRDDDRDVTLAPFIEAHLRDSVLFAAPHERAAPLVKEIARQLLATPGLSEICGLDAALGALDRLTLGWRAHARALPVHPRVARHFGLDWWSPDRLYELGHHRFSFRDYTIRYLRWSPWLA